MGKKRDRLEIIHDILFIIKKSPSIKRTHLMYKTNLTYVRLNRYLDELAEQELIILGGEEITLTEKGINFLSQVRKMKEFMEGFGL